MNDRPKAAKLKAEMQVVILTNDKPRVLHISFECENSFEIFAQMFKGSVMFRAGWEGTVLAPDFFEGPTLKQMWDVLIEKLEKEEVERLLDEASKSE